MNAQVSSHRSMLNKSRGKHQMQLEAEYAGKICAECFLWFMPIFGWLVSFVDHVILDIKLS